MDTKSANHKSKVKIYENKGSHIVHLSTMCHLFDGSARVAIFVYWSSLTNTNLVEDVDILLSVNFRWISLSGLRGETNHNVSANHKQLWSSFFPVGPKNTRVAIFVYWSSLKNTNLVEDVKILHPVKFHCILFSGFRGEIENVSANQMPGGHLVFSIGPKNKNLVEDAEILLPVKFRWILI